MFTSLKTYLNYCMKRTDNLG